MDANTFSDFFKAKEERVEKEEEIDITKEENKEEKKEEKQNKIKEIKEVKEEINKIDNNNDNIDINKIKDENKEIKNEQPLLTIEQLIKNDNNNNIKEEDRKKEETKITNEQNQKEETNENKDNKENVEIKEEEKTEEKEKKEENPQPLLTLEQMINNDYENIPPNDNQKNEEIIINKSQEQKEEIIVNNTENNIKEDNQNKEETIKIEEDNNKKEIQNKDDNQNTQPLISINEIINSNNNINIDNQNQNEIKNNQEQEPKQEIIKNDNKEDTIEIKEKKEEPKNDEPLITIGEIIKNDNNDKANIEINKENEEIKKDQKIEIKEEIIKNDKENDIKDDKQNKEEKQNIQPLETLDDIINNNNNNENKNKEDNQEIKEIEIIKEQEPKEEIIINANDDNNKEVMNKEEKEEKEPVEEIVKNNNEQNQEDKIIKDSEIKEEKDIIKTNNDSDNIIPKKGLEEENISLKPKKHKSDFELHIIQAYKYLIGQNTPSDKSQNNAIPEEKDSIPNSENILSVKNCEKEIRLALNSCIETKIVSLNKNILDKMSRIIRHNKINLIFVIGQIYINLMSKDYLFNPLNTSITLELLIFFCNEVISLKSVLKQTYLGNKFNQTLINFILRIMKEYKFEKEQLSVFMEILETHNINQKPIKIMANNFEDMVKYINDILNEQETFYDQYKFIFDNSDIIKNMINKSDFGNQNNIKYLNNYLDLGKIFSYLLFNEKFVIYLKQQSQENDLQGMNKKLFNGYEDNVSINVIEDEKFYIDIDEDIEMMRENLCKLIFEYITKFKEIKTLFEFQYVLYVLIKRIYFYFYEKYKDKIDLLLSEIVINLCFFKEETIEEIKIFINEILKSEKEKDSNLKKLIQEKIEQNKSNPDFNFNSLQNENIPIEQIQNYFTNITNISIETISISQNDLRIGFFNKKKIKAGEIFTFYVELSQPYGILDFCMSLDDYNIKLRIKNLTEGRDVYIENEVTIFHCPLKLTMFFTKPGIFQFEFDNSYSWLRSKTIRYKINKFYPQKAYYLDRKIILMKYQEIIYKRKKTTQINYNNYQNKAGILDQIKKEKIFLVKFNGDNNSFNCSDTTLNIEISNKMGKDNYLKISTIFINIDKEKNKSCFYAIENNSNNKLMKYELNKNNFMQYINENIISKSKVNIDIINLYIITENENIIDSHYISIEDILGFEPEIKTEELNNNHCKLLFFLQYFHQAQLIYYLFNKINNDEKFENVILISYNSYSGYQICLYKNGEIFIKIENIELNREKSLENNLNLIAKKIKEISKEEKIEILIGENINEFDKEMNTEKIGDELIKILGMNLEEEGNLKVVYLNKDFNKEVNLNSHIFYLDE